MKSGRWVPYDPRKFSLKYQEFTYHTTCTYHNIQSYINHATYHISTCQISCHEGIPARYIGNPSHISYNFFYSLVLRHTGNHLRITQEKMSATITCILDLCFTCHLVFTMTYFSTCSTDARATSVTSLHDQPEV